MSIPSVKNKILLFDGEFKNSLKTVIKGYNVYI